ncbi:hypothetical protein GCM10010299_09670 [Streptomyces tanashiensis]|nr:hypothetical protein GCM10010299_09670 [Streptomyces tanashiensis]
MDDFSTSWTALREAVAGLADDDFAQPSGCTGWLVRDLVCHLVIDAQDVLLLGLIAIDPRHRACGQHIQASLRGRAPMLPR